MLKAFLQIRVHESDRDVLRFLWGDSVFRMTSVPFGLTCSPSILQIVLRHHLQNCNGDAGVIDLILRSLYVDDVIVSVFEENVAVKIWDEAVRIMALAKINLRKLRTNCPALLRRGVHEVERVQKVAGIMCNFDEDVIMPASSLSELVMPNVITKRVLASMLARVYDPHGLICPLLSGLKMLLQDAWLQCKSWDECLVCDEFQDDGSSGFQVLKELRDIVSNSRNIKVPRWVKFSGTSNAELHIFCDASKRLYAACAYLRVLGGERLSSNLVAAKSRLVTPKLLEINFGPKFELLACFLAVKLGNSILEAVSELVGSLPVYCWTDSSICLGWIRGDANKHDVFVRNRLLFIQSLSCVWGYVPTKDNPADLPTRGALDLPGL